MQSYEEVHGRMPRGPVIDEHGLAQQVVGEPSDLERGDGISYDRQAVEDDLSDLSDVLSEAPAVQESRAPVCSAQSLAVAAAGFGLLAALIYAGQAFEIIALSSTLGIPILLTLLGWLALADGMLSAERAGQEPMYRALAYFPAVPFAITLSSFIGVMMSRTFTRDFEGSPLLGDFFLAFVVVNFVGVVVTATRSHTLGCCRHR